MSWKQWTAAVLVIGVGIVLQIPGHDDATMEHEASNYLTESTPAHVGADGLYRSIALDVTGMT